MSAADQFRGARIHEGAELLDSASDFSEHERGVHEGKVVRQADRGRVAAPAPILSASTGASLDRIEDDIDAAVRAFLRRGRRIAFVEDAARAVDEARAANCIAAWSERGVRITKAEEAAATLG